MPVKEQQDVSFTADPQPSHALRQDGREIHHPIVQQLEPAAETNVGARRARHSLPPNFLLPNIRGRDTSAPSFHQARDHEHTLDEATIANRTAALRRLNGVAPRHRRAESAAIRTRLAPQPIIVLPRPASDTAVTATMDDKKSSKKEVDLPAVDGFNFENILQAIEQEARGDVDAIAEICGRSKMSLANEYDAHMPPQGELLAARQGTHILNPRSSLNPTLTPVEEISSISERLLDGRETTCPNSGETRHIQHTVSYDRSIEPGHDNSYKRTRSTSTNLESLPSPTRAQQDVLKLPSLPVMLVSESASPAHDNSAPFSQKLSASSQGKILQRSTSANIRASKRQQALTENLSASEYYPHHSQQRQSSVFASWISWTSKPSGADGSSRQSSDLSAVSSLRSILTRSDHIKPDDHRVTTLA